MVSQRKFRANTKAPKASYAVPPGSPVGGKGVAKYPITSLKRARSALRLVGMHGSPAEKKMVKAKVKSKYPALAKRSSVIKTSGKRK